MPPQQRQRFLYIVDNRLQFGAHDFRYPTGPDSAAPDERRDAGRQYRQ